MASPQTQVGLPPNDYLVLDHYRWRIDTALSSSHCAVKEAQVHVATVWSWYKCFEGALGDRIEQRCRCMFDFATDDPDGLEAQVAALLGAAGSLSAHAMAEADEALAPKVSRH